MTASDLFVGMISGTSMDAVDVAAIRLSSSARMMDSVQLVATHSHPFPDALRQAVLAAGRGDNARAATLDARLGQLFAEAVLELMTANGWNAGQVRAIGSHGQTLWHAPDRQPPLTLQLGDPNIIAAATGVTVVADFRRADLARGGEGAPLAPLLHEAVLGDGQENRVVINLGGIANLSLLPAGGGVQGFDSGPANCLLDVWYRTHHPDSDDSFDRDGRWAASGQVNAELLDRLMTHPFLQRQPPKSTHTDVFDLAWLHSRLDTLGDDLPAQDVQATLMAFTADSLHQALNASGFRADRLMLCGGGADNPALHDTLTRRFAPLPVDTSTEHGLPAPWVEATLFAWLAARRLAGQAVDTRSITGADTPICLGGVWLPPAGDTPDK